MGGCSGVFCLHWWCCTYIQVTYWLRTYIWAPWDCGDQAHFPNYLLVFLGGCGRPRAYHAGPVAVGLGEASGRLPALPGVTGAAGNPPNPPLPKHRTTAGVLGIPVVGCISTLMLLKGVCKSPVLAWLGEKLRFQLLGEELRRLWQGVWIRSWRKILLWVPLRPSVSPPSLWLSLTQSRLAEESANLREALWHSWCAFCLVSDFMWKKPKTPSPLIYTVLVSVKLK